MEIAAILSTTSGLNLRPVFAPLAPLSISDTLDPSRIRRVLVTKLRHHGDVLLASPVLGALKRHLPEAEIDALVYQDTRDMLSAHPALSQLHLVTKRGALREEWRLFQTLRSRRYDLLIHLTSSAPGWRGF
jgi:heptosyltransferase III